jgi:UDP-N-acetylmuramoyl-tripeptide--D-alanyl-D-alanine ligase
MLSFLTVVIIVLSSILFATRRLLRYLSFLQQEEYSGSRFLRWVWQKRAFDRRGSATALVFGLLALLPREDVDYAIVAILGACVLAVLASREEDPQQTGKITLKMTPRAVRIYRAALLFYTLAVLAVSFWAVAISGQASVWLLQAVFIQSLPLWLVLAVLALQPQENIVQARFIGEAKEILASCHPYVIGITGSYGKTSTKNVLGKLLDVSLAPTFWPKGGVNTLMGITREIREQLKPAHKFAVIEMGAYQQGSIKKLCEFTPPRAAIVTAVGLMHLERFGSAENVYQAKSELAQALPADGILVCNGDNEGARRMAKEYKKTVTLLYGLNREAGELDSWMSNLEVRIDGTSFILHWRDKEYKGFMPIHGRPLLSNVLGAFTMACALGADPQYVVSAMGNLKPVSNRLEVCKCGLFIQINDAYNSNPVGFAAALEVLDALAGERKILVTPGMVELGSEQGKENERAGELAAKVCHLVFVVGSLNREALCLGLERGGLTKQQIRTFAHRDLALAALARERRQGDVVLLENDLPDLFEIVDLRF